MTHKARIAQPAQHLNPHTTLLGRPMGDVAVMQVTDLGAILSGVFIDAGASTGCRAGHTAISREVGVGATWAHARAPAQYFTRLDHAWNGQTDAGTPGAAQAVAGLRSRAVA